MENIIDVTLQSFQREVIEQSGQIPVLVDFWAAWCAPCKQLMPVLESVIGEYAGAIRLAKVNADEQPEITSHFAVRSLPTVKLFVDGQVVAEFNGARSAGQVKEFLAPHVQNPRQQALHQAIDLRQAGSLDEAEAILTRLNQTDPEDVAVLLELAAIRMQQESFAEARQILDSIPLAGRDSSEYKQCLSKLRFAEMSQGLPDREEVLSKLEAQPQDATLLLTLARLEIAEGNLEAGIKNLLEALQSPPDYANGDAKQVLIELFDMLGASDPLVRQYRRRLYTLLH